MLARIAAAIQNGDIQGIEGVAGQGFGGTGGTIVIDDNCSVCTVFETISFLQISSPDGSVWTSRS